MPSIDLTETQIPLLDTLKKGVPFGLPETDIHVYETHISWVIIAGDYAYKLKKAVRFNFLDFSSLEKREFFCKEELRLNQRTAPDLYLAVVPISGTPEEPVLNSDNSPFEYMLKMKRFSNDDLASTLLSQDLLSSKQLRFFAKDLSAFHKQCKEAKTNFGKPQQIWQAIQENFETLYASAPEAQLPRLQRLFTLVKRKHSALKTQMKVRIADGKIRECHGDLHLNNIVSLAGRLTPFDCIDFNEELRFIDVLSEISFLIMDLDYNQRPDLATLFLNQYLEINGDYTAIDLLLHYLSYRALVRAKVNVLTTPDSSFPSSYIELAERYLEEQTPRLIITHGLSGSGKSYLTAELLRQFHAIRLRSDIERKRLAGLTPDSRSNSKVNEGPYRSDVTRITYDSMLDNAKQILNAGVNVIIDAAFLKKWQRVVFQDLADNLNIPFTILNIESSNEELAKRIAKRMRQGNDPSEADLKVLDNQVQNREILTSDELKQTITIQSKSSGNLGKMVTEILTGLKMKT